MASKKAGNNTPKGKPASQGKAKSEPFQATGYDLFKKTYLQQEALARQNKVSFSEPLLAVQIELLNIIDDARKSIDRKQADAQIMRINGLEAKLSAKFGTKQKEYLKGLFRTARTIINREKKTLIADVIRKNRIEANKVAREQNRLNAEAKRQNMAKSKAAAEAFAKQVREKREADRNAEKILKQGEREAKKSERESNKAASAASKAALAAEKAAAKAAKAKNPIEKEKQPGFLRRSAGRLGSRLDGAIYDELSKDPIFADAYEMVKDATGSLLGKVGEVRKNSKIKKEEGKPSGGKSRLAGLFRKAAASRGAFGTSADGNTSAFSKEEAKPSMGTKAAPDEEQKKHTAILKEIQKNTSRSAKADEKTGEIEEQKYEDTDRQQFTKEESDFEDGLLKKKSSSEKDGDAKVTKEGDEPGFLKKLMSGDIGILEALGLSRIAGVITTAGGMFVTVLRRGALLVGSLLAKITEVSIAALPFLARGIEKTWGAMKSGAKFALQAGKAGVEAAKALPSAGSSMLGKIGALGGKVVEKVLPVAKGPGLKAAGKLAGPLGVALTANDVYGAISERKSRGEEYGTTEGNAAGGDVLDSLALGLPSFFGGKGSLARGIQETKERSGRGISKIGSFFGFGGGAEKENQLQVSQNNQEIKDLKKGTESPVSATSTAESNGIKDQEQRIRDLEEENAKLINKALKEGWNVNPFFSGANAAPGKGKKRQQGGGAPDGISKGDAPSSKGGIIPALVGGVSSSLGIGKGLSSSVGGFGSAIMEGLGNIFGGKSASGSPSSVSSSPKDTMRNNPPYGRGAGYEGTKDVSDMISSRQGEGSSGGTIAPSAGEPVTKEKGAPKASQGEVNPQGKKVASVSKRFESGSKGAAAIGEDPNGGRSYGSYQLSTKQGRVQEFLEANPQYGKEFAGLQPGTREFDKKWEEVSSKNKGAFEAAEDKFMNDTHLGPQTKLLGKAGIDLSSRGQGVQNMLSSTSTQYGPHTSVVKRALEGKDLSKMSDADIITAVQDSKAENVDSDFRSSPQNIRDSVANRIPREKKELISLADRSDASEQEQSIAKLEEEGIKQEIAGARKETAAMSSVSSPQSSSMTNNINQTTVQPNLRFTESSFGREQEKSWSII